MSCNPCCCLKLKDAAVTIGIWSTIYSLVQIAVFVWQFSVLAQCQHVVMAQSNLQCEYYCPCVGASTARTSAIIEGLFVIQILCLIVAFFLLFASIMMIYGVHTWSRYLLVPWMVTMCASILTSFAYCVMWWAGDVRDYWLMLTIVEMFGVFLNTYCFVVIIMFHRRMLVELEYYARRRKYDRFNQLPRGTPQHTIEQELDETDEEPPRRKEVFAYKRPLDSQFPPKSSPPQPVIGSQLTGDFSGGMGPQQRERAREFQTARQRTPMERFQQETNQSASAQWNNGHKNRNLTNIEKFRDEPNGGQLLTDKKVRAKCAVVNTFNTAAIVATHWSTAIVTDFPVEDTENERKPSRRRRRSGRKRDRRGPWEQNWSDRESDLSEFGHTVQSEREYGNVLSSERQQRQLRRRFPSMEGRNQQQKGRRSRTLFQANERELNRMGSTCTLPRSSQQFLTPYRGISIPQHIVIPPVAARTCETLDPRPERKYRINSEITVSYDPKERQRHNEWAPSRKKPPNIPPRTPHQGLFPHPAGYINLNTNSVHVPTERREPIQQQQEVQPLPDQSPRPGQLISMNSNV
uniref:Uncharacterized protein n=1 Tax=Globodera rostochiensis TaxID=31243 RepID=A0A914H1E5_GLORO